MGRHSFPKSQRIHNRRKKSYMKLAEGVGKSATRARKWLAQHGYIAPERQLTTFQMEKVQEKKRVRDAETRRLEEERRREQQRQRQAHRPTSSFWGW